MKINKVNSYYTPEQLDLYLKHVKYPKQFTIADIDSGAFPATVANLTTIMRLHLLAFPFENTAMHYTESHKMEVEPQAAFDRLVQQGRGYGSYCFGQNGVFLGVLRGLGYRAFAGGGRVNSTPPGSSVLMLTPVSHMVLLVQTSDSDETFVVDVGFGSGLVRPIPLREGAVVAGSAPPEEHRLSRARHPKSSLAPEGKGECECDASLEWRLEMRCGSHQRDWRVMYQFSVIERFEEDHDAQNFAVSQRGGSAPFWDNVICVAHFEVDGAGGDGGAESHLGRVVMMGPKVDKRVGDVSERVAVFKTDVERLRALKEYFGLNIPEHDVKYIKGRVPALPLA